MVSPASLRAAATSSPLTGGMSWSRTATSNRSESRALNASSPVQAVSTVHPRRPKSWTVSSRMSSSSSATSTFIEDPGAD